MKPYIDEEPTPGIRVALEFMTADNLRKLASLTGERVPTTRKSDIADVILRHLEGARLRTVWEGLDDLQRAAVAEVVHSTSACFSDLRFRAKYGREPNWGSGDEYSSNRKPSALNFFFYSDLMPSDLKARLKSFVPEPRPTTIDSLEQLPPVYEVPFGRGTEEIPMAVHERERAAARELFSVLRLIDAGKVAVSDKTRKASASTINAITGILDGGDYYPYVKPENQYEDENAGPIRAFAWPLLIQAGGLAQLTGTRLQLTREGRKALSDPPAATFRTLWRKWVGTTIFDELARIDCVKGQTGKGKRGLTAVSSRRGTIEESLTQCPMGKWISADSFFRYMEATGKYLEVAREAWGLYIGDPQYGSLGYENGHRLLNEGYLLGLLLEYVATLGMIDVALIHPAAGVRRDFVKLAGTHEIPFFSRYDGLMYFRITPLGAHCLGVESDYRPAPVEVKPVLRVLPNLEIEASGSELEQSDSLALDAYAIRISDFGWRLDAGKLFTAIEAGRQMEEIREFLVSRSGEALPETVVQLLNDVAKRTSELHDRGLARLIECADPTLAALIAQDPRTRKYCMRAGDKHLVVAAASETAFRRALRDVGYLLGDGNDRVAKDRGGSPGPAEG